MFQNEKLKLKSLTLVLGVLISTQIVATKSNAFHDSYSSGKNKYVCEITLNPSYRVIDNDETKSACVTNSNYVTRHRFAFIFTDKFFKKYAINPYKDYVLEISDAQGHQKYTKKSSFHHMSDSSKCGDTLYELRESPTFDKISQIHDTDYVTSYDFDKNRENAFRLFTDSNLCTIAIYEPTDYGDSKLDKTTDPWQWINKYKYEKIISIINVPINLDVENDIAANEKFFKEMFSTKKAEDVHEEKVEHNEKKQIENDDRSEALTKHNSEIDENEENEEQNNQIYIKGSSSKKHKNQFVFILTKDFIDKHDLNGWDDYVVKLSDGNKSKYTEQFKIQKHGKNYGDKYDTYEQLYTFTALPKYSEFDEYGSTSNEQSKRNHRKIFDFFNNKKCDITLYHKRNGDKKFYKVCTQKDVLVDGSTKVDVSSVDDIFDKTIDS